jgi:hypothetical protein
VNGGLSLSVPPELVEAIAELTAEKLAARLPNDPEAYMNTESAARYLDCETHRINDLKRQGLPCFKDGARNLYRREDLDDWLTRQDG